MVIVYKSLSTVPYDTISEVVIYDNDDHKPILFSRCNLGVRRMYVQTCHHNRFLNKTLFIKCCGSQCCVLFNNMMSSYTRSPRYRVFFNTKKFLFLFQFDFYGFLSKLMKKIWYFVETNSVFSLFFDKYSNHNHKYMIYDPCLTYV